MAFGKILPVRAWLISGRIWDSDGAAGMGMGWKTK